jgi:hypothetical protein
MSTKDQVHCLVVDAANALLAQELVTIRHEAGWKREGFPLPAKRVPAAPDGSVTQQYRPLALLEYAHDVLSGEISSRIAKQRNKEAA